MTPYPLFWKGFGPTGNRRCSGLPHITGITSLPGTTLVPFPLNLFIPASLGDLTAVLGVASLLLILGLRRVNDLPARVLLYSALAAAPNSLFSKFFFFFFFFFFF